MEQTTTPKLYHKILEAKNSLLRLLPQTLQRPAVGVICGSGLGGLADAILPHDQVRVSYKDIPHFPHSTVHGHAGVLLFGFFKVDQRPVILMIGRAHFYEGHSIDLITFPVRVMKLLGIETLIVTNAAGGLDPHFAVGDVVLISDHLNLAGLAGINPLRGPNVDEIGVRFPPLSDAYDLHLRREVHKIWHELERKESSRRLHEGVYAFVGGPSYETRAECRMLRNIGADLVGMSTVPEVIIARHCDIAVVGLSLVTNNAVLDPGPRGDDALIASTSEKDLKQAMGKGKANHEEVLEAGRQAADDIKDLVCTLAISLTAEIP